MSSLPSQTRRSFDLFEWLSRHEGAVDAAVAGFMVVVIAGLAFVESGTWVWWALPMAVLFAFLRTHTEVASSLLLVVGFAHFAFGPPLVITDAFLFYAVYLCVVRARRFSRRLIFSLGLIGGLLVSGYLSIFVALRLGGDWVIAAASAAGVCTATLVAFMAVWALGRYQRSRMTQLAMAQERARQAEKEREQSAQLAVAAERSRIAREMHDVIAHSLSVIIAQADGGRFVAAGSPERSTEVFTTIASTGRSALTDMRSLLGVLRDSDAAERAPQPGLAQLPSIIESFQASGLNISLAGPLPEPPTSTLVDLTLLRVVQESLTNVLKHAGVSSRVMVEVSQYTHEWTAVIRNSAPAAPPIQIPSAGQGIEGMRERVQVLGGSLTAGPTDDGGFLVTAAIPFRS